MCYTIVQDEGSEPDQGRVCAALPPQARPEGHEVGQRPCFTHTLYKLSIYTKYALYHEYITQTCSRAGRAGGRHPPHHDRLQQAVRKGVLLYNTHILYILVYDNTK